MKKLAFAVVMLCLALSACTASSEEPEPPEPEVVTAQPEPTNGTALFGLDMPEPTPEPEETPAPESAPFPAIDPEEIVVSEEIPEEYAWPQIKYWVGELFNEDEYGGHIAESYHLTQCQSYMDKWFIIYEYYLPRFTDEITGDGAETIKQYYLDYALSCSELLKNDPQDFLIEYSIIREYGGLMEYEVSNYGVEYVQKYLVVNRFDAWYAGGAHGMEGLHPDNFDTETGQLLAIEDVIEDNTELLEELLNIALVAQGRNVGIWSNAPFEAGDHLYLSSISDIKAFRLSQDGIIFIFNEYEISSYAAGRFELPVSWADLAPILKIEPPTGG